MNLCYNGVVEEKTTTYRSSGKYLPNSILPDGRVILEVKVGNRYRKSLLVPCISCGDPVWKTIGWTDQPCWNCHVETKKTKSVESGRYTKDYKKLYSYKREAQRRDLAWELSDDQAYALFRLDCRYCGLVASPLNGIDRVDNAIGYTIGNVVPCCSQCNKAKSSMGLEVWNEWLDRIVKYRELLESVKNANND